MTHDGGTYDRKDQAELAQLGQVSVDAVLVVDVATARIRFANDIAAAILKKGRDELAGAPLSSVLASPVERILDRAHGTRGDAVVRVGSNGELPVHLWVRDAESPASLALVFRDASEWEVAKSTLSLVATGVEHAGDAIEITDAEGRIEYANAAHASLMGRQLFDAMGEKITQFIVDSDGVHEAIHNALAAGLSWRGEVASRHKDGTLRQQDLALSPVFDGRGGLQRFVVIRRDITDRVELERQAEEMRAELALAERASVVGRLAAGVAHEVNNPATSILANLEIAKDEIDQLAREIELARVSLTPGNLAVLESWWRKIRIDERLSALREVIADSREGTDRVVLLVRELRNFVRPSSPKKDLVSLNDAVRSAVRIGRGHLHGRASLHLELGAVPRVRGDERRLGQVVLSILSNAASSIAPGDESNNRIEIRTFRLGDDVVLTVDDSGPGIAAEQLPRVFEPFFSAHSLDEGLGLAVSRDVVEAAGGDVRVESEGRGTKVIVRIPVAPEDHVGQ